jgi:hypothetical protein
MASVQAPPGDISQDAQQQQLQNLSIGGGPAAAAEQAANKKGGNGGEQQQGAGEAKELDPEKAAKKVRSACSAAAGLC